jgi:hypothetical protein
VSGTRGSTETSKPASCPTGCINSSSHPRMTARLERPPHREGRRSLADTRKVRILTCLVRAKNQRSIGVRNAAWPSMCDSVMIGLITSRHRPGQTGLRTPPGATGQRTVHACHLVCNWPLSAVALDPSSVAGGKVLDRRRSMTPPPMAPAGTALTV